MSELILYTTDHGKNQLVADFRLHPIWNALRAIVSWERSPVHRGNCQGVLDSSGTKTLPEERLAPLARQ